jgi:hypothetical protein
MGGVSFMKITTGFTFVAVLLAIGSTAGAEEDVETPAVKAAKAWHATMLDSMTGTVEVSKDKPLEYLVENVPTKSCRGLVNGRATAPAAILKLKRCLMDTRKSLSNPPPTADFRDFPIDAAMGGFDAKYRKNMKAIAKDGTVIVSAYIGDGMVMRVRLVVGPDSTIRAVWVDYNEFE